VRIGVVSKHDLYIPPIERELQSLDTPYATTYAREIEELWKDDQEFDYVFFPHYSKLVPENFFSRFLCIGFHIGNLPEDRGGSPIQNKIIRGEYRTFVNAFQITSSVDGGPIFDQKKIDLETGSILQILEQASKTIASMILNIVSGNTTPVVQPGAPLRFRRLTQNDSMIDFHGLSLKQIFDRIRMVDGLDYPRAEIKCSSKNVTLSNARFENGLLTFECEVRDDSAKR
jgi:methionyl-tRNA formyltransferase